MASHRNLFVAGVLCGLVFVTYFVWHTSKPLDIATYIGHSDPIKNFVPPTCIPKKRVAYLKVHKAASSTFANILKHFGYFRNITFALPASNVTSHFAQFGTLTRQLMKTSPENRSPDLLFHHVVYNHDAFASLLPRDMVYVASVREPVAWFISAFIYYRYDTRIAKALKVSRHRDWLFYIRHYLKSPSQFEYGLPIWRALYRMPYDFGIPSDKFTDEAFVRNYVKTTLDKDFKIVLIAENFDESLVLFKRYMCWQMKDILYLSRQVSKTSKPSLSGSLLSAYRRLVPASYIIYQHFLDRFYKQIGLQGKEFYAEVYTFKMMLREVTKYCWTRPSNDSTLSLKSEWTGEFKISGLDCFVMNYTRPVRLLAEDSRRASLLS